VPEFQIWLAVYLPVPDSRPMDSKVLSMHYTHTVTYYSALKSKEILTYFAIYANLEDIRLSDKTTNLVIPHR
jgi:hypothetical protein